MCSQIGQCKKGLPFKEPIEFPLPDLIGESDILTEDRRRELARHLPARTEGYSWALIYSTSKHGFSLKTIYRNMVNYENPVLLVIQDTDGSVFGALTSTSLRTSDHFYGTGETFLFSFYPEFRCFRWTGDNVYFIKGDTESIAFGAGDGSFGLWLDGDLYHGSSNPCQTFGNPRLSKNQDFVVKTLECWGFV
ncbi:oxidation resistance protein 1 [Tetranychus urticae]|uniref:Oxidation resistance protein 1 n=1 Tax=Tetranychus urticae TaxID=32264 RepID=T1L3G8_TETUR|nr:oxidation resistance protein 1 [Tetranychus urticae]